MDVQVMIPQQVENLQLPDPSLLNYYHNLQQRTLWIDAEVDEGCLDIVKKIIRHSKIVRALVICILIKIGEYSAYINNVTSAVI